MITAIAITVAIGFVGAALWVFRKDAREAAKAKATEAALEDITEANRPATADELSRVRDKYRRD